MSKVAVVGAGAAGLICAGFAAKNGHQVTVFERMKRPATKVLITGKGRCNVTNNCTEDAFIKNVRTNPRFLYSAIHSFSTQDAMDLFESLGVPLKTERGARVFPVSDQSSDIADAMVRFAKTAGACIVFQKRVNALIIKEDRVSGIRLQDNTELPFDTVIIATGGLSYPRTGSDGDGYQLAKQAGHQIVPCQGSLVPIITREKWCADMMGLSLRNVILTLYDEKGKAVFSELGEMLFTHFGISGPLVLSASSYMKQDIAHYRLAIDLKPGLSMEQLDARILRDFDENKNRDFKNALDKLLPKTMIPVVVKLSEIAEETKVHSVTKDQRRALAALLKALPLTPQRFRPVEEAVITAGGVSVKEINPKTMHSKLVQGLAFAGEVIDVDAFTGGFNLQIAYATAYLAANGIGC